MSKDVDHEELVVNEPYKIEKERDKKQIQKSECLIKQSNLIAYASVVAEEEIKDLDPLSYMKVTSCKNAAK